MTAAVLEEFWEYLDPKSVKRGPFATMRMAAWYEHQMLPEDLAVRHSASMPFIPIKELFHPPLVPFKSRPKPYVAPPAQPTGYCQFHWQYRDTKGFLQGPFSSEQMARWFEHGMLPERLQLKRTMDAQFSTIKGFFPDPLTPFVSQPINPWGVAASAQAPAPAAQAKANDKAKQLQQQQQQTQQQQAVQHLQMQLQMGLLQLQQQIGQMPPPQQQKQATQACAAPANSSNGTSNSTSNNNNGKAAKAQPQNQAQNANSRAVKAPQKNDAAAAGYPGGGSAASDAAHEPHNSKSMNSKENTKGRNNKHAAKEQSTEDWWSDQGWSGGDKWWEQMEDHRWSWWAGWSGDGWEQSGHESNGKGKQRGGGADWKGAADADRNNASSPKEKTAGAVQAAFGSLRWGPPAEPPDLFPEPTLRKILDEGIVWEERWVSPLAIRFSQGKIHPFFHERGPISEVLLQIKVSTDRKGSSTGGPVQRIEPPFPPIRLLHLRQQGVLVTLDNRRLYALQRFALQEWPAVCLAKALCVDELTPTRLRAENRKFTNKLCGLQLEIESRSNAFETFSWVTETAHSEAPRFVRPIAFRAADKSISLLPLLVVHTLMSPRFRDLLQSRWPLLEFVARLLPNPSKRSFPTKRILFQHVLELSRPGGRTVFACPPVCVAYKSETVVTLSKGRSTVQSKLAVQRPLTLLKSSAPISLIQRRVLLALLPMLCLPYARSALRGSTREWVTAVLLALGKVNVARLEIGAAPLPSAMGVGGGAA